MRKNSPSFISAGHAIAGMGLLLLMLLSSAGCGGYYILTVPDQLARTGGRVVPVTRLQRNDFFVLALPMSEQPMRFRIYSTYEAAETASKNQPVEESLQGPVRVCSSDKIGYSAVEIPMYENPISNRPGKYFMKVALQDFEGEQIAAIVPLYVWNPQQPVVAVDLDGLPREGSQNVEDAAGALQKIARNNNILYLTRKNRRTQQVFHERLERDGFPQGPILLWQRKNVHIVRDEKFKIPKLVVESRLESQLPQLMLDFPNLKTGICNSPLAAKAFVDAGMQCVVVGNDWVTGSTISHRKNWQDLTTQGP